MSVFLLLSFVVDVLLLLLLLLLYTVRSASSVDLGPDPNHRTSTTTNPQPSAQPDVAHSFQSYSADDRTISPLRARSVTPNMAQASAADDDNVDDGPK